MSDFDILNIKEEFEEETEDTPTRRISELLFNLEPHELTEVEVLTYNNIIIGPIEIIYYSSKKEESIANHILSHLDYAFDENLKIFILSREVVVNMERDESYDYIPENIDDKYLYYDANIKNIPAIKKIINRLDIGTPKKLKKWIKDNRYGDLSESDKYISNFGKIYESWTFNSKVYSYLKSQIKKYLNKTSNKLPEFIKQEVDKFGTTKIMR